MLNRRNLILIVLILNNYDFISVVKYLATYENVKVNRNSKEKNPHHGSRIESSNSSNISVTLGYVFKEIKWCLLEIISKPEKANTSLFEVNCEDILVVDLWLTKTNIFFKYNTRLLSKSDVKKKYM